MKKLCLLAILALIILVPSYAVDPKKPEDPKSNIKKYYTADKDNYIICVQVLNDGVPFGKNKAQVHFFAVETYPEDHGSIFDNNGIQYTDSNGRVVHKIWKIWNDEYHDNVFHEFKFYMRAYYYDQKINQWRSMTSGVYSLNKDYNQFNTPEKAYKFNFIKIEKKTVPPKNYLIEEQLLPGPVNEKVDQPLSR